MQGSARLAELGVSKSEIKFLSPVVAKAVFGEKLSIEEQSVLINSDVASQVVKELTQEARNIIWRDKKGVTSRGGVASFVSKDGSIKTMPYIVEKDGIRMIGVRNPSTADAVPLQTGAVSLCHFVTSPSHCEGVYPLGKGGFEIDERAFVDGLWEGSRNREGY